MGTHKPQKLSRLMFFILVLFSLLLSLSISFHFVTFYFPQQLASAEQFLREKNNVVTVYIEGYFKEIVDSITILAGDPDLPVIPWVRQDQKERILHTFKEFQSANANIYYIYAGYIDGSLLINNYEPPPGYDVTVRPWYRAVMDQPEKGKLVTGLLYRKAKTNELLLSTIHILENPRRGFTGAVAIDSYIESISSLIQARSSFYKTSYSFICNSQGELLVHPRQELVGKHIQDLISFTRGKIEPAQFIEYTFENVHKIAYISSIPLTGWLIFTVVNKQEITGPIIHNMIFYILLVIILCIGFSLIMAAGWYHWFMKPLILLHRQLELMVNTTEPIPELTFPHNEIGEIAKNIEKLTATALFNKNRELAQKNAMLEHLAVHDFLTGQYNRRKIDELLQLEYERYQRYREPFSLIMIDIDHFKQLNDTLGHHSGDLVLQELAHLVRSHIRNADAFGRWGGEEFLIILFNTPGPEAAHLAEKLCGLVASHHFSVPRALTISLGVGEMRPGESLDVFLCRVDDNLYRAKESGRNQIYFE